MKKYLDNIIPALILSLVICLSYVGFSSFKSVEADSYGSQVKVETKYVDGVRFLIFYNTNNRFHVIRY